MVELPNGQQITLAVTVPVLVAPAPGEEPVPAPGTDPTDPADPADPTDPTVPGATDPDGGLVAVPIAGGGFDDVDGGPLAYTGAEIAGPALAAALLLLAGVTALVLVRRKRAAREATVRADG